MKTKEEMDREIAIMSMIKANLNCLETQGYLIDDFKEYLKHPFQVKRGDVVLKVEFCPDLGLPNTKGYQVVLEYKGHEMRRSFPNGIGCIFSGELKDGITLLKAFSGDSTLIAVNEIKLL